MRAALEREDENDSEITLNATTLLGIFFGLVLICGVFFGFGYSLGRRGTETPNANTPAASAAESDENATPAAAHAPKPSAMESLQAASSDTPGSNAVTEPVDTDTTSNNAQDEPAPPKVKQAILASAPASKPSPASVAPPAPAAVKQASLPLSSTSNPTSIAAGASPTAGSSGAIMVQIAAVSHQEDANALVSALRQHGYTVSVRNEPQDKLLHVQVGPFATRDEAKTMRSKLLADGYNAILKP